MKELSAPIRPSAGARASGWRDAGSAGVPAPEAGSEAGDVAGMGARTAAMSGAGVTRRRTLIVALAGLVAAACKILPISEEGGNAPAFSGKGVVDKLWPEQVVPTVTEKAVPVEQVLDGIAQDLATAGKTLGHRPADEGSPWSFIVKGKAVVKEKNTTSRAGTILIEVTTARGPVPVIIQIGPVVKGNSLRDAMPFISFQSFTNQIEFAEVGRALNDRAMAELKTAIEATAAGQEISFAGTLSVNTPSDKILLTPVLLSAGGA